MNDGKNDGKPNDVKHEADGTGGEEKWIWCQRCQRCYCEGEFRLIKGIKLCPYNGCMGLTVINGWPWSRIQKTHPDYPKTPERDAIYESNVKDLG
jgi:hypothetical protein